LGSQHPADAIELRSGHLLLAYGNRREPFGAGCLLSRDGGRTWDWDRRTMVGWVDDPTSCGYPSSAQLDDGAIVTVYYSVGTQELPDVLQTIAVRYREDMIGQR
jgi:hypothetical protein